MALDVAFQLGNSLHDRRVRLTPVTMKPLLAKAGLSRNEVMYVKHGGLLGKRLP